jgi:Tfp pilus assembly protein PilF
LQNAVRLAPRNAYCHLRLGVAYLRSHRLDEAKRELEQATQLDPNNAKAHYQLGRYYAEIHDLAHAKMEFDRTVAIQTHANRPTPVPPKP